MSPERRLLLEVALTTGLRANELRELRVRHLDRNESGLRLDTAWTKNRKDGFQPLPQRLLKRLLEHSEESLAAAWPLPNAVRSGLLAMLDELRREDCGSAARGG